MILIDVNVLVYAHREDVDQHPRFRSWLETKLDESEPVGLSELALSGVLRVLTHPKVFSPPTPTEKALTYADELRSHPNARVVRPAERHWEIFTDLVRRTGCKGNLVPDAYHAALAIEWGCEWVTTDRGFSRFPQLRWRHPLEEA